MSELLAEFFAINSTAKCPRIFFFKLRKIKQKWAGEFAGKFYNF